MPLPWLTGLGSIKSVEGAILIAGAVFVGLVMVFEAGSHSGSQRAEASQARAVVIANEQTQKSQGSLDKKVANLEVQAKVHRVRSEKKATDAVAQIQAREPATDPVLVWAAAIDSLRDEASSDSASAAHSRSFGGNAVGVQPKPAARLNSWTI